MSKTFTLRTKDGGEIEVEYTPIVVIAGSMAHKLALHKDPANLHWVVSDPKCGAKVCVVDGQYKGVRTSSVGLGKREVRSLAMASVDALIQRVGSEMFNKVLANPKPF